MYVVEHNRHAMARSLCEADISRNHALKDLCSEEAAKIGGNLFRKRRPVIVHCQQDAFDRERWIDGPSQSSEGIQEFGHAFKGKKLALDRNQNRVARSQCIHGEYVE
jgi:hypothetical protein